MTVSEETAIAEIARRNPVQLADLATSRDSPEAIALLRYILATPRPSDAPVAGSRIVARSSRARRGRRAAVVAVAASAAVAGAIVATTVLSGSPVEPATAAASALNREARVAGRAAHAPLAAGQYLYTKSTVLELAVHGYGNAGRSEVPGATITGPSETFSVLVPITREVWVAPDGAGRLHEVSGTPKFLTPADRVAWVADGKPDLLPGGRVLDLREGRGGLGVADLSTLPTDASALGSLIAGRKVLDGPPGEAESFKIVGELLSETDASPALRAALYVVAARIPGVALVGKVTDSLGRSGTAVSYTSAGESHELVFDPVTSRLLATEDILTDPAAAEIAAPVGTVVGSTTYVSSGYVDSTTDVPTAPSGSTSSATSGVVGRAEA